MTALSNISDVINRFTGGNNGSPEHIFYYKSVKWNNANGATVAGRIISLWRNEGSPGAGATPSTSATVPTNTTAGGFQQTNPGGSREKWLMAANVGANQQNGMHVLYDRILHISGLSGTSTSPQTVGGTLTRYSTNATCVGNQIFVEIYTAIGATSRTITASYTNQAGSSGQTTIAAPIGNTGYSEIHRMIPIPLAIGDTGVSAVASVTLSASTGTAGNFGITIARPILAFTNPQGIGMVKDQLSGIPGPIKIETDACLALYWVPNSSASGSTSFGSFHFIES